MDPATGSPFLKDKVWPTCRPGVGGSAVGAGRGSWPRSAGNVAVGVGGSAVVIAGATGGADAGGAGAGSSPRSAGNVAVGAGELLVP